MSKTTKNISIQRPDQTIFNVMENVPKTEFPTKTMKYCQREAKSKLLHISMFEIVVPWLVDEIINVTNNNKTLLN